MIGRQRDPQGNDPQKKKHVVLILVLEPGFPSVGLILDAIVTDALIIARTQRCRYQLPYRQGVLESSCMVHESLDMEPRFTTFWIKKRPLRQCGVDQGLIKLWRGLRVFLCLCVLICLCLCIFLFCVYLCIIVFVCVFVKCCADGSVWSISSSGCRILLLGAQGLAPSPSVNATPIIIHTSLRGSGNNSLTSYHIYISVGYIFH